MTPIHKNMVEKRFIKAANTYRTEAVIQNKMADFLVNKTTELCSNNFATIFEAGCGTGLLTDNLIAHLKFKNLYLNDLAEETVALLQRTLPIEAHSKPGDVEKSTFPKNIDLFISGSTFQWVTDLPLLLNKIHTALSKNGVLSFSSFGTSNFVEIKKITGIGLDYFNSKQISNICDDKYNILFTKESVNTIYFKTPEDILKHIKLTGVNSIEKYKWTKKDLTEFKEKYNEFFKEGKGFPLTYNPLYFILRKK